MNPRSPILLLTCVVACSSPTATFTDPTQPAPPPEMPPPDGRVEGEPWSLITTQKAVHGPALTICWETPDGSAVTWEMAVARSGDEVKFVYDVRNWPTDAVELRGRVNTVSFVAKSPPSSGKMPCHGIQQSVVFSSQVTGEFSADGASIIGTEVWTYKLSNKKVVSIEFEWRGSRK